MLIITGTIYQKTDIYILSNKKQPYQMGAPVNGQGKFPYQASIIGHGYLTLGTQDQTIQTR